MEWVCVKHDLALIVQASFLYRDAKDTLEESLTKSRVLKFISTLLCILVFSKHFEEHHEKL